MTHSEAGGPADTVPIIPDYGALVCQVLKTCLDHRIAKLPSIPLVKLLYLSECEYYRLYRRRLTALGWFFYKFGPWASELAEDPQMVETETSVVSASKCIKYHKLDWVAARLHGDFVEDLDARAVVRRVVTPWALRYAEEEARWDLTTRELLNEVYFQTAPMREASYGEALDFALTPPSGPSVRIRLSATALRELRRKVAAARGREKPGRSLYPLPGLSAKLQSSLMAALERVEEDDRGWFTDSVPGDVLAADDPASAAES